jgi:hypothetical protein
VRYSTVAPAALLCLSATLARADPAQDVRAFCATFPKHLEATCLQMEMGAKDRVTRQQGRFSSDREIYDACVRKNVARYKVEECISTETTVKNALPHVLPKDLGTNPPPAPSPMPATPRLPSAPPPPRAPSTIIFGPVLPPPTVDPPRPPAKPITTEEADAMTKRAKEQNGAKQCETKIYGGGAAVTVCE